MVAHWSFWPLLVAFLLRVVGLWWGLPGSDAWDNDGVAPRDLYPGLVATFTPGEYYTYPPFHLLVLGILCSPALIWAAASAPSLRVDDIVQTMLQPGPMTTVSVVARAVGLMLSLATTFLVADLARRSSGPRAARMAAWAGAANMAYAYYGKTSNLDVPSVFYAVLSVWFLARDALAPSTRHKVLGALAAAFAVGTKDQSYAFFVLLVPACVVASWAVSSRRPVVPWLLALVAGASAYAVASGFLLNPRGFLARVAFLRGPASQDFKLYSNDWAGRLSLAEGALDNLDKALGAPVLVLALVGLCLVPLQRASASRRVARGLPGVAALSFFVFFNGIALRNEDRFVLGVGALLAFYFGLGVAWLDTQLSGQLAFPVRYLVPVMLVPATVRSLSLDAALLHDPRYRVEQWLREHPAASVEVYGNNVYLPRLSGAHAVRISPIENPIHNPLPGLQDHAGLFADIEDRAPDVVIVPHAYVWRYLPPGDNQHGRIVPPVVKRIAAADDGRTFFSSLFAGTSAYDLAFRADCSSSILPVIQIHAAVCEPVSVFVRRAGLATPNAGDRSGP